jgi:trigger factor
MNILKNKRHNNTVTLEIEESPETIQKALTKAFAKIVKTAKIPGFRKGKIPRDIFEKHYGTEYIEQEGIMYVVNDAYLSAIKELKLEIVDMPKNFKPDKYKPNTPFKFSCEVDVKPTVKLGKYKGLKVEKETTEVTDEQIEKEIEKMQQNQIKYEVVDRKSKLDDLVKIKVEAKIDNEVYQKWTEETVIILNNSYFGTDFDKEVIALQKGDTKEFQIKYPKDFKNQEICGKKISFKIELQEVKEKNTPELTDEIVAKSSPYKTVADLKKQIRTNLETQAKNTSEKKLKDDLLDLIIKNLKTDVPPGMIHSETDYTLKYLEYNLKNSGFTLEKYLAMTGKSPENFKTELQESSLKKIKTNLALENIAKAENIIPTEEEIKAEIEKIKNTHKIKEDQIQVEDVKHALITSKTYDFLIANAKIK